jgi:putative glycosyltransferase
MPLNAQKEQPPSSLMISIVTSLYMTEELIEEFYRRSVTAAETITDNFEIIMVNDGSPDNSLARAVALHQSDKRVKVIDLARNFGHHPAIRAGLDYAQGELIYVLDGDLEEDPAWLPLFYDTLNKNPDTDVVYGIQKDREGSFVRRALGKVYYKALSFLSNAEIEPDHCNARLMTRRYLESLKLLKDYTFSLESHFAYTGYKQISEIVTKPYKGESSYTFRKKINLALNTILGNSAFPLEIMSIGGLCITVLSALVVLLLTTKRILFGAVVAGNTIIVGSIWLIGGMTIFCLGIVGLYISRIFLEAKNYPVYIVKKIWE